MIINDKLITAILSTISAIAVGYVPVWVARINARHPTETPKEECYRLKKENAKLKEEIKRLKGE
ncbi:hypothetical protein [Lentilactobacillus sp. Marseille-Q4993]|uniref:hypothetical protein n=1 Tax=Lentilactobacillus sp. Marseille-Q4993 TaxID=3039492 RepID=UPI0024BD0217|nr:hypothetical protein [Lentilactobacillus sp. Marseille-Q4993]